MKFMKLGSKPDAFQSDGNSIRYVSSDLEPDVIVNVDDVKFQLHKFPLLSKSILLQKLIVKANEESSDEINLPDFPGGPKSFEICAKFCYGITITLNPYNVVAARCGAEYLEMSEDSDRSNLIFKIEVFLNSSVFRSWKDSIIVLQTSKSLLPWSEDLKVVGRCIDSIASKTSIDPSNINWSYTYNRKLATPDKIIEDVMRLQEKALTVPKDWWVEDICELDIDLYTRVMTAVRSKGRMDGNVIGEALKTYLMRWLPNSVDALASEAHNRRNKALIEAIIGLLPSGIDVGCSCSFLLKLLKFAILVGADDEPREDLIQKISLKLDEASVNDLLIPTTTRQVESTKYDVELVISLVKRFMMHEKNSWDLGVAEKNEKFASDLVLGRGSLLNVGKLVDGFLAEAASDPQFSLSSFFELSQSVPESARPIHDGLYKAIDVFLKEHPELPKADRKKICGLIDLKRLTMDASMHAAQNELLPLRLIVQVLFFEQARAASGLQGLSRDSSRSTVRTEDWEKPAQEEDRSLRKQMDRMKMAEGELPRNGKLIKKGSKKAGSAIQLLPSRSRRIFDKLWAVGKGGENKSSETSVSSQSPTSMVQGETKSFGDSSSRQRRYSIS